MDKPCVNGNCSRRKECGAYHQAVNTLEASGDNGRFERYTCKKGLCDHFTVKIVRGRYTQETQALLDTAEIIVKAFGEIAKIVNRFETEENYNSLAAIEAVAKIVKGEVANG